MAKKITIKQEDEENFEIFVGKKSIGQFNHDEHGWEGMASAKKLLKALAKEFDIEVVDESF